jgi:hypothetical protein
MGTRVQKVSHYRENGEPRHGNECSREQTLLAYLISQFSKSDYKIAENYDVLKPLEKCFKRHPKARQKQKQL